MLAGSPVFAIVCALLVPCIAGASLNLFGSNGAVKLASNRDNIQALRDFLHLKTGPIGKQAYWYYNGVVRNPLTGLEVAGVEGVEIVRPLETIHTKQKLVNGTMLGSGFAGSYLSKKMFVYVDKTNRSSAIEQFRVRHHAPLRAVNPVKQYSELVTMGVEPSGNVFASVLWPTGRLLRTNKIRFTKSAESTSPFDELLGRKKVSVINFMSAAVRRTGIAKHPLSKWVSFSPTSDDGTTGRSQEYYTISNTGSVPTVSSPTFPAAQVNAVAGGRKQDLKTSIEGSKTTQVSAPSSERSSTGSVVNARPSGNAVDALTHKLLQPFHPKPAAVLSYRRYGEGPPWFAVGRACVIEMSGARYDRPQALPASVRALVDSLQPDFFINTVPAAAVTNAGDAVGSSSGTLGSAKDITPIVLQKKSLVTQRKGMLRAQDVVLSKQWFDQQADPADSYKPWYTVLMPQKRK